MSGSSLKIKYWGLLMTSYVFLLMLFPISLLELFNINPVFKVSVFVVRMISLLGIIMFFLLKYKYFKIPKIALFFFVLIAVVGLSNGITKFTLDILIVLMLAIFYYNFELKEKEYINKVMCNYFIYFPLFIALLVSINILDRTYYDDGTLLLKMGFNNPNYFSFLILFGVFIAYLNNYKKQLYIGVVVILVSYVFTKTVSVVLVSLALVFSLVIFSKRTFINKLLLIFLLALVFMLLSVLVFYPTLLLPENWKEIATWEFQSNLLSRIHNNAFKLLEIKEQGFWFGGISSKEDNFFVNYWAAFGIIGVVYFIYLSFKTTLVKYKYSFRISVFMIAIILLGQIEQTLYSTAFPAILYFYYLLTINEKYYSFKLG